MYVGIYKDPDYTVFTEWLSPMHMGRHIALKVGPDITG